ncbi:MAG TPA: flagellar hook protein FlgE [Bryobacteraceae bacterium]|nr:flagellar hook protein FlgE [Bryobacteraceae bacterium]
MFDAFSTALSALNADSTAINIVGNNLANLNTTGFKAEDVQFSDLMSQQLGISASSAVGTGVSPAQAVREFTQGSIQQTNGPLDAAIDGSGFFMVKDTAGEALYTRAGNFTLGADGTLLTANGDKVQGWNATAGVLNLNGAAGNITIPVNAVNPASATANASLSANLDASAVVGAPGATFSAPMQVVDSQGGIHTLSFTFTKTAVNAWSYTVTIPSADLKSGGTTQIATGSLAFDGTGQLTTPASTAAPIALKITGLADGASDMNINWNLYNGTQGTITQFAQSSGVASTNQDGVQAGQIVKVAMSNNGVILASYSNGQQSAVAQLAVAGIQNPDTMVSVGNNNLMATAQTAAPAVGTADSGGRGKIEGGSLETSTVDIATEFTNLISFQRSYEAASKTITTVDQMTQDLISLKQ